MIVSILRDGSISGMAMRFVALWKYLDRQRPQEQVWLFANTSLVERLLGQDRGSGRLVTFEDRGGAYMLRRVWSVVLLLWSVVRYRIDTLHLVAGGVDFIVFLPIFRLLGVKVCMTFATAGLEVGAHGSHLKRLRFALSQAPNVEFLNPKARVPDFPHKRFYSPCSFPYILGLGKQVHAAEARRNWIVFAGSFAPWKNPVLAVEAFGVLLKEQGDSWPDLELRMFGKGQQMEELRRLAAAINEAAGRAAVRFEPEDQLFEQLAQARVFLSLQVPDNYPSQSLMEAMLYENSIVATDVGETRRIVPEAGNALVEVNPSAVKNGMLRALAGAACNRENAQFILEKHSPARFGDYFLDVHRNLAG